MKYGTKTIKLLLACAIVFGVSYFYLSYYRNVLYDLTADEGYILYGAKRVLDGQILYKDFFQFYPPGDFYLLALMYKLFGYSFAVAHEVAIIIDSLINALFFYLSYKAIKSWYAILPPLYFLILGFPNWMQYSHYWSSMLFLFVSLVFFLHYIEQNKALYLYLTGFWVAITGLFLQTTGVYAVLVILLVLLLNKRMEKGFVKHLLLFFVNICIPLFIVFGYIAIKGGLIDFIKEQYFLLKIYAEAGTFNPIKLYFNNSPLAYPVYPYRIIFLLYVGTAVLSAITLTFLRKKISGNVKVILMAYIILFLDSTSRMDFDHILINSSIFFTCILFPVKLLLQFTKQKVKPLYKGFYYVFGCIGILLAMWGAISIRSNIINLTSRTYKITINSNHLLMFNHAEANEINEFIPQAKKLLNGAKRVFVYPYGADLYVLLNLDNPTFTDMIPTIMNIPDYGEYSFNKIVNNIIKQNIDYIIYCNWPNNYINAILTLEGKKYHVNVLDKFIHAHYIPVLQVNELILYKKI